MQSLPARFDPRTVEEGVRSFWGARGLPAAEGPLGGGQGPVVHQLIQAIAPGESLLSILQRAVVADAEARYLLLAGKRVSSTLFVRSPWVGPAPDAAFESLARLGVWVGGRRPPPPPDPERATRVQSMVAALASADLLVGRELPLRSCPQCRTPRTPETIIYQSEEGPAYLVRFPLEGDGAPTSLVVWTDALWKLLGTTAVLLNPDLPYVALRHRRRGAEERILVAKSAVERLRRWLPESELEILEERPGGEWAGPVYRHPLATEFPALATGVPPAGTLAPAHEVGDSGTGLVALVPSHGAADAAAAAALRLGGFPVVGPDGAIVKEPAGKYAGLPLETAEAFILRDLTDGGYVFAQLTVRRGVPRCGLCGSALVWLPTRAWCLEPGRLPPESLQLFARLLPGEPVPLPTEIVPWPATQGRPSEDGNDPALAECASCERLAAAATGSRCACGGTRVSVRRKLLPAIEEAFGAWAKEAPTGQGDSVRLYLGDRRRAPALIHHLAARQGLAERPTEVRLVALPTIPASPKDADLTDAASADALRAALVRTAVSPQGESAVLDRRGQEARRLRKLWELVRGVATGVARDQFEPDSSPLASHLAEFTAEDRAFLSSFERLRLEVLRNYDAGHLAEAQERLARFMEVELRDGYLAIVRPRLQAAGLPPEKASAYRLLLFVLNAWAELFSPIAPFTMEAIARTLRGGEESLFERRFTPVLEMALDPASEAAYGRWLSVVEALRRGRRAIGLAADAPLPSVVLLVKDEEVAKDLRAAREVLLRLLGVGDLEVASPREPWEGKRVEAHPVKEAIQRVFGTQTPRVIRLLEGLSGRRVQDGVRSGSLSMALEGHPVQILPTMVEFTESLPEDMVPIAWGLGEILVQAPEVPGSSGSTRIPAMSLDGFRLVRAVQRRLARTPDLAATPGVALVVQGDLAAEVKRHRTALARHLGVPEISVLPNDEGLDPAELSYGRTRRGERWAIVVPGSRSLPARRKLRPRRSGGVRVRPNPNLAWAGGASTDYLSEESIARQATIQSLVERLDAALGVPLVGPSKMALAWEAGLRSYEAFTSAPFERLAPVPGFGPYVAAEVVRRFGGTAPTEFLQRRAPTSPSNGAAAGLPPAVPEAPPSVAPPVVPPPPVATARREAPPEAARELPDVAHAPPPAPPAPPPPVSSPAPEWVPARPVFMPGPALEAAPRAVTPPVRSHEPLLPPPEFIPVAAPTPPPPVGLELRPGGSEEPAWNAFLEATASGDRGLCLSREFPERRRGLLGQREVDIVWLSNVGRAGSVRPTDLEALQALFRRAVVDLGTRGVFLEGVEYLMRINGREKVVALLREADELCRSTGARMWVPLNPALMAADDVAALESAFPVDAARAPVEPTG